MSEAKNIHAALLAFQADPPVLAKNKSGHQSKYADLVQVNEKVLSRLNEFGIVFSSAPTMLDDGKFVLEYELTHVDSETSKGGRYPLKLSDNPQQMGSAITYARRYVLQSLTSVAAEDEDDDGHAAGSRPTVARAVRPRQQPAPSGERTAQRAPRAAAGPPLPGETDGITGAQSKMLYATLRDLGLGEKEAALAKLSMLLGRDVDSTRDLSKAEATKAIDALIAEPKPGGAP